MKKVFLSLLGGSLLAATAVAQSGTQQSQGETAVVEGCLSKLAKGPYIITASGPEPRQFRVTGGDTSGLSSLVEHTVRVTGIVGESDPQVQVATPPNPGSTTGVTYNTIDVEQVQDVTSNCSVPGTEKPK